MKTKILFISILSVLFITLSTCRQKNRRPDPDFYKNLYTEEIFNKSEFEKFTKNILFNYIDTTKGKDYLNSISDKVHLSLHFYSLLYENDSIIQPFKYDIRIGKEYIVRENPFEKIGTEVPLNMFKTIKGDSIQIGGEREKPILINLWFIECPGCIAEIPALNRLQEKYADKVDFIAMTFESEKDVLNFLNRKKFNFNHIADADNFIKEIGTKPYPESIFIDRKGYIKYIEGGLSNNKDLDSVINHFESLLEDMLKE